MTMHIFGYTVEIIQPTLSEGIKGKPEPHDILAHAKMEEREND